MVSIAAIQSAQDRLIIESGAQASLSFSVSNIFNASIEIAASFTSDDASKNSWITIAPPIEREVNDQETCTFIINVAVPEDTAAGEYSFTFLVYSVEDPNLDFSKSDPIVIVVPERKTVPEQKIVPKKSKWWLWVIIGIATLAIIIGIILVLSSGQDTPVVDNKPCDVPWTKKPLSCDV